MPHGFSNRRTADRGRENGREKDPLRERGSRRHLPRHIPNGCLDASAPKSAARHRDPRQRRVSYCNECRRPSLSGNQPPCPHPSSGCRKPARTPAGKADGMDMLLANVESQHRHAAQLNTHAHPFVDRLIGTIRREYSITCCSGRLQILKTSCSISEPTSTTIARIPHEKGERPIRRCRDQSPISAAFGGNLTVEAYIRPPWLPDLSRARAHAVSGQPRNTST
jgi:hypothetical protein